MILTNNRDHVFFALGLKKEPQLLNCKMFLQTNIFSEITRKVRLSRQSTDLKWYRWYVHLVRVHCTIIPTKCLLNSTDIILLQEFLRHPSFFTKRRFNVLLNQNLLEHKDYNSDVMHFQVHNQFKSCSMKMVH